MSEASTRSAPYTSLNAGTSSAPTWPTAPVTRIRFIPSPIVRSALRGGRIPAAGCLRNPSPCHPRRGWAAAPSGGWNVKTTIWLGALLVLPAYVGNASAQAIERFSLSGPRAAVFTLAGEVRIERGSGQQVEVEVTRGGADADELTVRTSALDGWSALRVNFPDDRIVYRRLGRSSRSTFDVGPDGSFGGRIMRATLDDDGFSVPTNVRLGRGTRVDVTGTGSGLEAWSDLRLLVPDGRTVAVHLGVGRVVASNVNGDIRIEAGSGSVAATGITGSL